MNTQQAVAPVIGQPMQRVPEDGDFRGVVVRRRRARWLIVRTLVYGAVLLPALAMLVWVEWLGINMPVWDQWTLVPFLVRLHEGTLTFQELWQPRNEHRVFFPRIIMLAVAQLTNWDVRYEMRVSVILATASLGCLYVLARTTIGRERGASLRWSMLAISALLFSTIQYENWFLGWQLQYYLNLLMAVVAITILAKWSNSLRALGGAGMACFVATHSVTNGLLLWPICAFEIWRMWRKDTRKYLLLWCLIALVSIASFLCVPQGSDEQQDRWYALKDIPGLAAYILAYTGAWAGAPLPVVKMDPVELAEVMGAIGIVATFAATAVSVRMGGQLFRWRLPWLLLAAYALIGAVVTAIGRLQLGVDQALASRYVTFSNLLWVALAMLAPRILASLHARLTLSRSYLRTGLVWLAASCAGAVLLFIYIGSYAWGVVAMLDRQERLWAATPLVYSSLADLADGLPILAPHVILPEALQAVRSLQVGPFSSEQETAFWNEQQKWRGAIASESYATVAYPPGDLGLVGLTVLAPVSLPAATLSFVAAGPQSANVYLAGLESRLVNADRCPVSGGPRSFVQVQTARHPSLKIYWDTGSGLHEGGATWLYPVLGDGGDQVSVTEVPDHTRLARLDVQYGLAQPPQDALRVVFRVPRCP